MSAQGLKKFSGYTTNGHLKRQRALIVTPSSTKAMDVSGGVAKVNLKNDTLVEYLLTIGRK